MEKGRLRRPSLRIRLPCGYRVDSISKPHASSKGSGMYLEFLFRRAHSCSRVERKYWSGESLYSCTTCSNSVIVGVTGPIGSGLPQFGFPRRLAMKNIPSYTWNKDFFFKASIFFDSKKRPGDSSAKRKPRPQILAPRPPWKLLIIIGFSPLVKSKVDSVVSVGISPLCTATCGLTQREHVPGPKVSDTPLAILLVSRCLQPIRLVGSSSGKGARSKR